MKHKLKKLGKGHYIYRGYNVDCCGYVQGQMCWEAVDEFGCGFAHSNSLKTTKALIDWELDQNKNIKNNNICPVCGEILGIPAEDGFSNRIFLEVR